MTESEVGAAAFVDPEAAAIEAPGVVADAGRTADLANELDITAASDVAPVSAAVVGGAGDAASVARLCVCWCGYCNGGCETKSSSEKEPLCTCHLASFEMRRIVSIWPRGEEVLISKMRIFGRGLLVEQSRRQETMKIKGQ